MKPRVQRHGQVLLEIGGGTMCLPGYVNMDPTHGDTLQLLGTDGLLGHYALRRPAPPIPLPDGACAHVRASHVLEHIPAGEPLVEFMREAWRVLRFGGQLEIVVPLADTGTWHAFADPTHVSLWVPERFGYLTGQLAPHAEYGLPPFDLVGFMRRDPTHEGVLWEGTAVLAKHREETGDTGQGGSDA